MFQLGILVVLCGLLTGTSASVSEFIQSLNLRVEFTEDPASQDRNVKINLQRLSISLDNNRSNFPLFVNNMRIRFNGLITPDLETGLSSKGNSIEMKMSLVLDSSMHMPNDNPRNNTTIVLKLQCSLRIEIESQKSLPHVTMWKCSNETMEDISDSSGRQNTMMDSVMDIEASSLTERVSLLLEKQILQLSDAVLKLRDVYIVSDLLMEENESPSE